MARGLAALFTPARVGASATPCSGRTVRVSASPAGGGRRRRRSMVVRAGGPPSTNVLILAFVLPLSLFVGTLITAARVSDDLDERFLREMEFNKAIMEENEDFEQDGGVEDEEEEEEDAAQPAPVEEGVLVAAAPRTRNRPKREVQ
uniref:High chlorophyll fluorescence 153 n=1 Tax=Oryza punctata TaxID=4537 RepID=A0A0E0JTG8_ORYPU